VELERGLVDVEQNGFIALLELQDLTDRARGAAGLGVNAVNVFSPKVPCIRKPARWKTGIRTILGKLHHLKAHSMDF
jgi:hypothetical protein